MKYLIVLFCLTCFFSFAKTEAATPVTWTWKAPTTCSNGVAVSNCPTTGYRIYAGPCGQPKSTVVATPSATDLSAVISMPSGTQCVDITTLCGGTCESVHSPEGSMVVPPLISNPPSGVSGSIVTTAPTAYTTIRTTGKYVAVPVGTIPLGTPCDATQPVLGLFVVPAAAVTWSASTKTLAPLAACGG